MSTTTLNRIKGVLHRQFDGLIDLTDREKHPPEHKESHFLTRALAALAIRSLAGIDEREAAGSVVDGYGDFGIDAIHFDGASDVLYLAQSKWSGSGQANFDEASVLKFIAGVKRILNDDFEGAGQRLAEKADALREALYSNRDVRIRLITIHTGLQPMASHVSRVLDAFVEDLNDPVEIADHQDFSQAGVYSLITAESKDPKIAINAVLNDWGMIDRPFLAYYGRIPVQQIVQWWGQHGNRLFSQNLRLYYQNSSVNAALRQTLIEDPESFWYFNNGITIIADKVIKGLAGAPAHKFANFACEGASIVNGAQTVGTIGTTSPDLDKGDDPASWVQVRIISLEKCPPDFSRRITRAANLQNAVGNREFAAMDPLQQRLAVEFALDRRRYVYKSGEVEPKGETGCSIVESTQALACAHSPRLAAMVKREIGSIWADTDRAPYTDIFNDKVSAARVWNAVSIMRAVDNRIHTLRSSNAPRADLLGSHMQRIVLHMVFQDPAVLHRFQADAPVLELTDAAEKVTEYHFRKLADYIERNHPNDYLANFSKNAEKCEATIAAINAPPDPRGFKQDDLFGGYA